MKHLLLLLFVLSTLYAKQSSTDTSLADSKLIWENKNIWIKTYVNNKNYYTTINNIVIIEQKIKRNQKYPKTLESLKRRLALQKSKLELYERNKSFETLLVPFSFEVPEITAYDYFYKTTQERLLRKIETLIVMKNEFNKANSLINSYYKKYKGKSVTLDDVKYFEEFLENINKVYLNLIESRDELEKRYNEYYQYRLQKHILTLSILLGVYLTYKILSKLYLFIERRLYPHSSGVYAKVISILFYLGIFLFLLVRYLEDFIYIITFLSVVAAALTIALREVLLNIVASVYIFFSNMLRVGDRVMVQFETKHTIGDITDISFMKIRLNEIEDYSNLKEVKSVGRTIYIPNSYVFTKVFYNYSRKKNGIINDLIEFEFGLNNDFTRVEEVTQTLLRSHDVEYKLTFTLNALKSGVIGLISYQTNYKELSYQRGILSIALLQAYVNDESIELKSQKTAKKAPQEDSQ